VIVVSDAFFYIDNAGLQLIGLQTWGWRGRHGGSLTGNNQNVNRQPADCALSGKTALRYNIGVRFFSFVVLVALLSGGVVGFVMIRNSRDYLRQQALRNNLNQRN